MAIIGDNFDEEHLRFVAAIDLAYSEGRLEEFMASYAEACGMRLPSGGVVATRLPEPDEPG